MRSALPATCQLSGLTAPGMTHTVSRAVDISDHYLDVTDAVAALQGVASGDPFAKSVILWTRVNPSRKKKPATLGAPQVAE